MNTLAKLFKDNNIEDLIEIYHKGRSFGITSRNGAIIASNTFKTVEECKHAVDVLKSSNGEEINVILI